MRVQESGILREDHQTKVAIAGETLVSGGLGHYVTCIDRALREHAPAGHQIVTPVIGRHLKASHSATLRRSPAYRYLAGIAKKVVSRKLWPSADSWAKQWQSMPADVMVLLPHVVFNDHGELDSYYDAIAARPFVWVIHDLHGYHYPDQWKPEHLDLMHRRFATLSDRAAHVITQNNFTANDVTEKLGIPRQRISIGRQPSLMPSWPKAEKTDAAILADLGLVQPYAIWSSSSTFAHKNHERLLSAWRLLRDRGHYINLVCTGSRDPNFAALQVLCRELGIEEHVRFTGVIEDAQLGVVLRNAHLAVCPTLFEGGGSGPATEAVLMGLPLAASSIPPLREQFDNRDDICTYFDPLRPESIADAVEELLKSYEASKRRAEWARLELAELQSWRSLADVYWTALDTAVFESAAHRG